MYRNGWVDRPHGDSVGDCRGGTDAVVVCLASERPIRLGVDIDLEFDERNELYRVRQLDRNEGDCGRSEYRCPVDRRDLYADVHRKRRIGRADRIRICYIAGPDRFAVRFASDRSIGNRVAADLEHDERFELCGVRCVDGV